MCLLESGNVDFVEGLFGIKALTNEDNNILLSDLKDWKGIISYFITISLIYSNYHYINANYILSQEATALGPSHDIGYLSPDSSLEPYRAEYGCGYPVKRLFELLELQTGQFDLQLQPMARQPQYYSRCLCLPLFGSAAKVHDGSSIN